MKQNQLLKRNIISLKGTLKEIEITEKEIISAKKSLFNISYKIYKINSLNDSFYKDKNLFINKKN